MWFFIAAGCWGVATGVIWGHALRDSFVRMVITWSTFLSIALRSLWSNMIVAIVGSVCVAFSDWVAIVGGVCALAILINSPMMMPISYFLSLTIVPIC